MTKRSMPSAFSASASDPLWKRLLKQLKEALLRMLQKVKDGGSEQPALIEDGSEIVIADKAIKEEPNERTA